MRRASVVAMVRYSIFRRPSPRMSFTDRDLEYLEGVHAPLGPVLQEMLKSGRDEGIPIVSPAAGRVLHVLVLALAPKRVLEIGTAIGFSTLWMASALPLGSRLDTIDPDRARTDRARRYWLRAGVSDRIRVTNEPALRVLPRLEPGIEFAFIDALKPEYAAYLDGLLPKMAPGGLITVDNVLWSGRIAAGERDENTDALRAFNEKVLHHEQLEATIVPVGDGLGIGAVRPHAL